jgi:uncharacterized protein YbbC (DUF1343 family)
VLAAIAEALSVDARIPRLYIAHGFMAHNTTTPRMFRLRVYLIISIVAIAPGLYGGIHTNPAAYSRNGQVAEVGKDTGVRTGIDVLEAANFDFLKGKRVGIITNQTGVDSEGRRTIDVISHASGVKLVAIFSPEHGIAGRVDAAVVESATDTATGLPIYSLYGATRRPTDAMLAGIEVLVFDIQDAGVRFYTYITTMGYCMEEAAKHHISFVVLDRPNPIGGDAIEGPMLDADRLSFVGYFPLPVRYGMTLGELAQMFNVENKIGVDLHVVATENWHRADAYSRTGLTWIPPSPNLRTLTATFLYPGLEILQAGGISVGRGTDTPFEILGAPWIDSARLVEELNRRKIQGVQFSATTFSPSAGLYDGQTCEGVKIKVTDAGAVRSMTMGLEIAGALHTMYPREFQLAKVIELLGSKDTLASLERGEKPSEIVAGWAAALDKFRATRGRYLLYH